MIGCDVVRPDGSPWGHVAEIEPGDFQDLLVIHDGEVERLLPLVDAFVTADRSRRPRDHVDPPEGLPESKRRP